MAVNYTKKFLKRRLNEDEIPSETPSIDSYFLQTNANYEETDSYTMLEAGLKTSYDNFGILHRNVYGPEFFTIHNLMEEYYNKIGEISDEVVETGIRLGHPEISVANAVNLCPSLIVKRFDHKEVVSLSIKIFEMLVNGFEACYEDVPNDVKSKFDEYIFWIRQECCYKLKQYLEN